MRFNLTKKQLGDFIIMLLFDSLFDDEFLDNNEEYRDLVEWLSGKGAQSRIFKLFFKVDGTIRSRYKIFRKFYDEDGKRVSIDMYNDINEQEDFYKELITEVVKRVTGKEDPNPEKLQSLQEDIINDIIRGEINEKED